MFRHVSGMFRCMKCSRQSGDKDGSHASRKPYGTSARKAKLGADERTADHNGKQRKPLIPRGEDIKDNTRDTTDDHGTE